MEKHLKTSKIKLGWSCFTEMKKIQMSINMLLKPYCGENTTTSQNKLHIIKEKKPSMTLYCKFYFGSRKHFCEAIFDFKPDSFSSNIQTEISLTTIALTEMYRVWWSSDISCSTASRWTFSLILWNLNIYWMIWHWWNICCSHEWFSDDIF